MSKEAENLIPFAEAHRLANKLKSQVETVIFGQESLVEETVCTFLVSGHILMTGAPGLAKTTLVRVFAHNLGLQFGRIQFTPDLLPSDIIGSEVLNMDQSTGKRHFEFSQGPIFVNLLLADEINRASPRTQSALLEAMQEKTITAAGNEYKLDRPFMVFATQNPFESEGTFPLPEAQLDRFVLHTLVTYPQESAELRILTDHAKNTLIGEMESSDWQSQQAIGMQDTHALIYRVKAIPVADEMLKVINQLVRSTRPSDPLCHAEVKGSLWYGAGPRASLSLVSVAKAYALLSGAEEVRWSHVRRMAKPCLRHRIKLSAQAFRDGLTEDSLIEKLLLAIENQYQSLAKGSN